jgi:glycosyltransferase involved in cell wall biosynthesis
MDQKIFEKAMISISVILPNYNHERFLKERIESILNQTSDNSKAILDQYRHHEKVSGIFYNEKNSGSVFSQWQIGINKAKHDWIWIAESDDSSDPLFLEKCVAQIKKNPTASMIVTQSDWVNDEGRKWFERQTSFETEGLKKGKDVLRDFLLYENPVKNTSAVLFNKTLINTDALHLSDYRWCGDWALWSELCSQGDLYFIEEPLNHFRRHENAASNDLYYKGWLYKEGLQLSLAWQKKLDLDSETRHMVFRQWCHHLLNQYRQNAKTKRFRLYLFTPLYYCVLMHLSLPVIGLLRLMTKIGGRKQSEQLNS